MRTRTDRSSIGRAAAVVAALAAAAGAQAGEPPSRTLANLHAAFAADLDAQARYAAFADQAERERRPDVAALLRAAAHAEGVRARTHAAVLRGIGAEPRAQEPRSVDAGPTRANLLAILAQENAERGAVYPRFVDDARREGVPDAVLAFTLAHHAEESLVRLYQQAISRKGLGSAGRELHVCETCGHVVQGDPPERCPVSLSPRAAFTRVR